MGTFEVCWRGSNPYTQAAVTVDALVDSVRHTRRCRPVFCATWELNRLKREGCESPMAGFSAEGRYGIARVIFGPPDHYLMGATTLEDLALVIDPMGERVIPDDTLYL